MMSGATCSMDRSYQPQPIRRVPKCVPNMHVRPSSGRRLIYARFCKSLPDRCLTLNIKRITRIFKDPVQDNKSDDPMLGSIRPPGGRFSDWIWSKATRRSPLTFKPAGLMIWLSR
jgi:hypothetical protein